MSHDDEQPPSRPIRRPSSSTVKIEKWGLIQAWLSRDPSRLVLISCGMRGLQVTVVDPLQGEQIESVENDEDPSSAALRGISLFAAAKNSSDPP